MVCFAWALLLAHLARLTDADAMAAGERPWRVDDLVRLFSNGSAREAAVSSLLEDVTRRATGQLDSVYRRLERLSGQLGLAGSGSTFFARMDGGEKCSCYCRCPRDAVRPAEGKLATVVKSKMADVASKMAELSRRFANDISSKTGDEATEGKNLGNSDDDKRNSEPEASSNSDYDSSSDQGYGGGPLSEPGRKKRSAGERSESSELEEQQSKLKSQLRDLNSLSDKVDVHVKKIKRSFESIGQSLRRALKHSTKLFGNVVEYGSKLKNKTLSAIKN